VHRYRGLLARIGAIWRAEISPATGATDWQARADVTVSVRIAAPSANYALRFKIVVDRDEKSIHVLIRRHLDDTGNGRDRRGSGWMPA